MAEINEKAEVRCVKCGSANVVRKKRLNNWMYDFLVFAGCIVFHVKWFIIAAYIGLMVLKAIAELIFMISSRKKWTWKCKACKKEFETPAVK